jgi:histidine triad (HIT) family protein
MSLAGTSTAVSVTGLRYLPVLSGPPESGMLAARGADTGKDRTAEAGSRDSVRRPVPIVPLPHGFREEERMQSCLFCNMAAGRTEASKLHDDDLVFAVRDIHPRAPVHFMVIAKEHIPSAKDIGEEHGALLARMVTVANQLAKTEGIAKRGYRLTFNCGDDGGQVIYHLHLHVLGGRRLGAEG